ncbi:MULTISPECIES: ATP-dependent Clp protease proteolytic subunit [unclassified Thermosynechococcus]|uniref:ATP-dependent Clp protease proteolytic subunit n=1 Tax=unclassified Thermosynechococcus TaxID=2622553 RepID=UPI002854F974|nr:MULTISPECIES: ATP-dependent Clp protease proteolytic subunit [unclassified Thermosynechococcus]MDR5640003.1 ATP-dependent Clp protease proteolytic subunit [Thermosynechococcus sp. PP42]MDR7922309.1 ATP-dependent Clp protease proteolytic subunit [Thermosynechococcus sp. HY213]MDR7992799.1 ATP-dependent Clp protease proteolytic subunit [Thermosynechococcus sp. TG252]WNC29657.1 ATP-dependent Clp protease proteolytic subunit [Thermosynechococcus sp. PKX82]WNC60051.1 ATP-dependent Clp protease p
MRLPLTAAQAAYYGDAYYRTPPPDLPSLLLKERIVYLGMPLVPAVTELIIAELLYLQYDDPEKPIRIYINSTGTSRYDGEPIGFETEAFAICDTMRYIKPPVHTICIGQAMGMAAMLLSAGTKGYRASLPHATIVLHQTKSYAQGQATDIQIRAKEVLANKAMMVEILAQNTGQPPERITRDMDRLLYMTPQMAKEYGIIDRILEPEAVTKKLPATLT